MAKTVTDACTHEVFQIDAAPARWRPMFESGIDNGRPYKWEMFIPHLVKGIEIGGLGTDIWVYATGYVSWPGRDIPKFANAEDAIRYVEATYALEGGEHG